MEATRCGTGDETPATCGYARWLTDRVDLWGRQCTARPINDYDAADSRVEALSQRAFSDDTR